MGSSAPRRRAPDEAAIAVLVGVESGGSTDDGVGRERAEIAAVETVADLPVHQEQLAVRDQTAARPNGQWSPTTVVLEGISHGDAVDGDRGAVAAHGMPRKRREANGSAHACNPVPNAQTVR